MKIITTLALSCVAFVYMAIVGASSVSYSLYHHQADSDSTIMARHVRALKLNIAELSEDDPIEASIPDSLLRDMRADISKLLSKPPRVAN